ncbi:hypothetical protein P153DRAFT_367527 [Dothidotthia symphoricarpi CBS 119687]|uniref:Uncharacterized protein n=1 Tax=Dothidotthia symphoricarpi CBS 119687 TaxID=1392245 RepID=A0A6A6A996_9PLEO|nr:uncharacterized protein P153DRAFT_367527 [Dothidotthia symphoricarpi CBS 119687]KAF2128379.1 hypothetical protein P153DRAFT_367527 [Dothidotthia symphoricarpi CBS 119687]
MSRPTTTMDSSLRPTRPPPTSRRNLFHASSRRPHPTVRADTSNIFQQPMEDELVERLPSGDYTVYAPQTAYAHMAMAGNENEGDEAEHDNQMIELYGQKNPHWDAKAVEDEIRAALKRSLREKVASLEDDGWMFQGEKEKK